MSYDEYLKKYGKCEGLVGKNEKGENVVVSIDDFSVQIKTLQNNGWARINIYYKDGAEEELYSK